MGDVETYLRSAAEQVYKASLELMSRVGRSEEVTPKEIRELAAALRELMALREAIAPVRETDGVHVVFEGGEESWSK